ncbi:MAG: YcxB family protein [Clostridia bacterium]|nr:YcxB family protein [Clostridia bacterium]
MTENLQAENAENTVYINRFTPTEADYKEFFRRQMFRSKAEATVLPVCALALALLGLMFPSSRTDWTLIGAACVMAALLAILYFWLPGYNARTLLKRTREGCGKEAVLTTRFTDEKIVLNNAASGATLEFRYEDVKTCMESQNLYHLKTRAQQVLILRKGAFAPDDEAGFKAFIARKCPSARLHW